MSPQDGLHLNDVTGHVAGEVAALVEQQVPVTPV